MKSFENKILVCAKMRQEMESEGDVRNLALRERRMNTHLSGLRCHISPFNRKWKIGYVMIHVVDFFLGW